MLTMTASQLRKELFHALDRVAHGETVEVRWKGASVARLTPAVQGDWREGMGEQPRLVGSPAEAFAPLEDVWEGHVS
jgi:antitoxin (DNA-binding transcriptional repressor) of toxin-antitoxin stability system